jgi:WD40 repeat protein
VVATDFHPDGSVLISAGMDGLARCWDIATGSCLATLMGSVSGERGLGGACFSRNGRYCLLGALDPQRGSLGLWDVSNSGKLNLVRSYARKNSQHWLRSAFIDSYVVGGEEDGSLTFWDANTTDVLGHVTLSGGGGGGGGIGGIGGIRVPIALATCDVLDTRSGWIAVGGIGSRECALWKLDYGSSESAAPNSGNGS